MTEQNEMKKHERMMEGLRTLEIDEDTAKKLWPIFTLAERHDRPGCVRHIKHAVASVGFHYDDAEEIAKSLVSFILDGGDALDLTAAIARAKPKRFEKPRPPAAEKPHRKQTRLSGPMMSAFNAKREEAEEANRGSEEGGESDDEKALRPPGYIDLDPDESPWDKRPD